MPILTEGPLGFPQTDKQARALDAVLKALPRDDAFRYRQFAVGNATTEVGPGGRAEVSGNSTQSFDRSSDVALSPVRGTRDSAALLKSA